MSIYKNGIKKDLYTTLNRDSCCVNCSADMISKSQGYTIDEIVTISGVTGDVNLNIFSITGTVFVLNQWAEISEVTTLTNMTDVYSDLWDGTNSVKLTKSPGPTLSNAPVGTFFTKNKVSTETYSIAMSDECRMLEATNKIGQPFSVTQKYNTNTYIRFNFSTTDDPISLKMRVIFNWVPSNGGNLELVS